MPNSKSWLHCNDTAFVRTDENKVNNISSYIYFVNHIKSFCSSYLLVKWLRFLSLLLGVMTLHLTSVLVHFVL